MAKGGGKGKGRPRKTPQLSVHMQSEGTPIPIEKGECSYVETSDETVDLLKKQIELEISSTAEKQGEDLFDDGEKEAKAVQIEEGKIPPMRNRGMQLGYIPPTLKEGIPTAKLCISELEKEADKWKNAVIIYVIGDSPTITYLKYFLEKQCLIEGKIEIYYHNEGYFMVRFELTTDRDKMLYEGPYTIASRPIIVKEWVADFCFEKEVLREIPLWVRLPKLPLNCWSGDSLSRIGSVLGNPLCADECTTEQKRISYARMLVEIDITKPLQYSIQIEWEGGKMVEQKVFYEWVPLFCQKCQRAGHVCRDKKEIRPKPQKTQWQPKGKEKVVEEEHATNEVRDAWQKPQKATVSAVIQVGRIPISTGNPFQQIATEEEVPIPDERGGDPFPFSVG